MLDNTQVVQQKLFQHYKDGLIYYIYIYLQQLKNTDIKGGA